MWVCLKLRYPNSSWFSLFPKRQQAKLRSDGPASSSKLGTKRNQSSTLRGRPLLRDIATLRCWTLDGTLRKELSKLVAMSGVKIEY
jgi:hypothetical protein